MKAYQIQKGTQKAGKKKPTIRRISVFMPFDEKLFWMNEIKTQKEEMIFLFLFFFSVFDDGVIRLLKLFIINLINSKYY